jgi:tRNA(adenine34) deaminase
MTNEHQDLMRVALGEAEKSGEAVGRPVGSVVTRDGVVVGRSGDRREVAADPTAHAEVLAIRDAARNLGRVDLAGCTLYTTLEPCPMCSGAILVSGISALVVGAVHGSEEGRAGSYTAEGLLSDSGWDTAGRLVTGVLAEECAAVRQRWGR